MVKIQIISLSLSCLHVIRERFDISHVRHIIGVSTVCMDKYISVIILKFLPVTPKMQNGQFHTYFVNLMGKSISVKRVR